MKTSRPPAATREAPGRGTADLFETVPLRDQEFQRLSDLIHRKAGIYLRAEKKELLKARLGKILRQRGIRRFSHYYRLVVEDETGAELAALLDAISTNLTQFFRERRHLDFLTGEAIPEILRLRRLDRDRTLRIWSAGCASGEEPFSLVIACLEAKVLPPTWRLEVQATDLSTRVLAQAERGIYDIQKTTPLPRHVLHRYFQKGIGRYDGYVRVKETVRRHVRFLRHNLMEPFPWRDPMDIIFCRNVMIYFDKPTQERTVRRFHACLRPGGFLFVGHSESLIGTDHPYRYVRPTVYRKEPAA
ncbi:protein-glutamate O-methyltransferase CheR [Dissulfurirhabdus thermomarina]|uniref:protein-glutamate O-methyltransferase n=1 Tax=Dissulfurirhabdus thermomarina TaxID=1765737 RepID=A0A6N9TPG9_DISTH|nr:protein-glutamate O-methyltransferase CheR [Dissulfurirhabdus thermomarina]NDY43171.1 protein-glutamate O-methyltransferase CheR [Dissulfurirhabdus thermomarina]NMX22797.1 protein-glutamate O-methyltransferase CheR [Dissulfurirhabdus thermomarina]